MGTDSRMTSASERSTRTLRPARSPPACVEVWPPNIRTRSDPTWRNAVRRARWKPSPYEYRMTKHATPQARLVVVRMLRRRLNRNACPASWNTELTVMGHQPCGADPLFRAGPPGPALAASEQADQGVGRGPGGPPHNRANAHTP